LDPYRAFWKVYGQIFNKGWIIAEKALKEIENRPENIIVITQFAFDEEVKRRNCTSRVRFDTIAVNPEIK
jgi:hypothetical protein